MVVFDIIQTILSSTWALFGIEYPGLGISFATIAVGSVAAVFSLRLIGIALGLSFHDVRGGNNQEIKISDERSLDVR